MEIEDLQPKTPHVRGGHDINFHENIGPTYQLMLLTASLNNFFEVVDKAAKVELAIKVGLILDAPLTPVSSTRSTPKKAAITRPEANFVQAIEVPRPSQNNGHVLPPPQPT